MKRVLEIEKEYKSNATTAIKKFFNRHPELNYWKEEFEYMDANGIEHTVDDMFADGTKNQEWTHSLWLDKIDETHTYICIIERA